MAADPQNQEVIHGDCREILKAFPEGHFDSCVTDPPYELGFMGKKWDAAGIAYDVSMWAEVYRVLRPGAHLLACGGTRTYHRMTCAIEDAGFEIRDSVHWIYGSGFPKSLDVSKAIDKHLGVSRAVTAIRPAKVGFDPEGEGGGGWSAGQVAVTAPATEDAARWEGWGTALKPAHEPIVVARKPFSGNVAANVLEHGTGGLNIDGCRVEGTVPKTVQGKSDSIYGGGKGFAPDGYQESNPHDAGRWPPNVLLTHSADCVATGETRVIKSNAQQLDSDGRKDQEIYGAGLHQRSAGYGAETLAVWDCAPDCPVVELDTQSGISASKASSRGERHGVIYGGGKGPSGPDTVRGHDDSGGASRFFPVFYCPKAPQKERPSVDGIVHATVKPLALMRWLTRLVTPPGGLVLDPFAGSGTTGEACQHEGFDFVLIEREEDYIKLISQRLSRWQPSLFEAAA